MLELLILLLGLLLFDYVAWRWGVDTTAIGAFGRDPGGRGFAV